MIREGVTLLAGAAMLLGFISQSAGAADAPTVLALGSPAPMTDMKMKNVDGQEVSIAQVAGKKGTLVIFSCNACPWAKAWQSRIVSLGNAYAKRGVGVIVVNSNDPGMNAEDGFDVMVSRAKSEKMTFPYVVDASSDVARAFGATRTPEAFLFNAEGKLVYHGTIDDNAKEPAKVKERYLESALKSVASGKSVAVQETKAFGCGIKFRQKSSS